ncbi:MAG TPA: AAA family ATPase [Chthoniobacteraceae bacterium]|nr:AAA family ATPase [Chthoniobacteraceae bacterium]
MPCRLHIFGASGSGATTLGSHLANHLHCKFLDTDSYYWLPTNPPFTHKRPPTERIRMIERDIAGVTDWVLSGSLCSWGDPLLHHFTTAIFLYLPAKLRMSRLAAREHQRYGLRIHPGGDMHTTHLQFMS